MTIEKTEAIIEAILFSMGDPVSVERIAQTIEHDTETTRKLLHNMMDRYEEEDRGIQIMELDDRFQLGTKKEMYDYLIRITSVPKKYELTEVQMEVLSIVAFRQPVTRLEIEKIRGVKSDSSVNRLLELELIEEVGRKQAPGRPILFGTTQQFLRHFGFRSTAELPLPDVEEMEEIEEITQEEADVQVEV